MGDKSEIGWTHATWNPTRGCTKVSKGCLNCYIDRTPPFRIKGIHFDGPNGPDAIGASTGVELFEERLDQPLRWARSRLIFVNSLSDLFHDDVPDDFIAEVFAVMHEAQHHVFQLLTKRPARMRALLSSEAFYGKVVVRVAEWRGHGTIGAGPVMSWPIPHLWVGVSVEDQDVTWRIRKLLETPAAVRFLSCEPLLGALDLRPVMYRAPCPICRQQQVVCQICRSSRYIDRAALDRLDWVIVGGESGPQARPVDPAWIRSLRDQVKNVEGAFFFKQWGGRTAKAGGRLLDGRTWDEFPPMPKTFAA